jgi:hypothetical protein
MRKSGRQAAAAITARDCELHGGKEPTRTAAGAARLQHGRRACARRAAAQGRRSAGQAQRRAGQAEARAHRQDVARTQRCASHAVRGVADEARLRTAHISEQLSMGPAQAQRRLNAWIGQVRPGAGQGPGSAGSSAAAAALSLSPARGGARAGPWQTADRAPLRTALGHPVPIPQWRPRPPSPRGPDLCVDGAVLAGVRQRGRRPQLLRRALAGAHSAPRQLALLVHDAGLLRHQAQRARAVPAVVLRQRHLGAHAVHHQRRHLAAVVA